MSFLSSYNSEFLSARITQKGRNAIAKGNFNIEYFQIGDSEFDYSSSFAIMTGLTTHQKVMSPFDKESGIKYPYKLDNTSGSAIYGVPIQESTTYTIRNIMGPAGYLSEYNEYNPTYSSGTTIHCGFDRMSITRLSGSTTLDVSSASGSMFYNCGFITVMFGEFGGSDPNLPVLTGNSNSYIYKVTGYTTGATYDTLYLDRPTPNLTGLTGNIHVICNDCNGEYNPCVSGSIDFEGQLNSWTLNVVWGMKPIGSDVGAIDESLSGYTSNRFVSTKSLLGYTTDDQTFTNISGTSISYPTSFVNSYGENILVEPQEQRCIAIVHFSDLGDLSGDPERFYRYDDFISYDSGSLTPIAIDRDGNDIDDYQYFEVYLPFVLYHRTTGTTYGAVFTMDSTDYYINSSINDRHQLLFRYLLDETGVKVGKVFPKNKIVVFDDQELVAILDSRSNRKFTLGAPKVNLTPSDEILANDALLSGSTNQNVWVTYLLSNSDTASPYNFLPSNYYVKVTGTTTPSDVTVKFTGTTFQYMTTALSGITDGYVAKKFKILAQRTNGSNLPSPDSWKVIDFTTQAGGDGTSYMNPTGLTGNTFVITEALYDAASIFDLETYMGSDYLLSLSATTETQFGEEQPFPGSVRLIRAIDVEQMDFKVNLPSTQFLETQNPTYVSGNKYVTEVGLLNGNKEVMVISKAAIPVQRTGTQVFSIRLDF